MQNSYINGRTKAQHFDSARLPKIKKMLVRKHLIILMMISNQSQLRILIHNSLLHFASKA